MNSRHTWDKPTSTAPRKSARRHSTGIQGDLLENSRNHREMSGVSAEHEAVFKERSTAAVVSDESL